VRTDQATMVFNVRINVWIMTPAVHLRVVYFVLARSRAHARSGPLPIAVLESTEDELGIEPDTEPETEPEEEKAENQDDEVKATDGGTSREPRPVGRG